MSKLKQLLDPLNTNHTSHSLAIDMCQILQDLMVKSNVNNIEDLKKEIKNISKKIQKIHPLEFPLENIVRRVNKLIDDSQKTQKGTTKLSQINQDLGLNKAMSDITQLNNLQDLQIKKESSQQRQSNAQFETEKKLFKDGINDLIEEITQLGESINELAPQYINSNDVIMTFGHSKTVEQFLKRARVDRNFEVLVLLTDTNNEGQEMAKALSKANISVSVIPFASAYAFMPRVNKIFIGVHSIMKNGGILARAGTLLLATAAKSYKIDMIVLGSTIKLTPLFPFEQNTYNELINPKDVLKNMLQKDILEDDLSSQNNINIIAAKYDYIEPSYITLYITNNGEHAPDYIYQLFNEYYNN